MNIFCTPLGLERKLVPIQVRSHISLADMCNPPCLAQTLWWFSFPSSTCVPTENSTFHLILSLRCVYTLVNVIQSIHLYYCLEFLYITHIYVYIYIYFPFSCLWSDCLQFLTFTNKLLQIIMYILTGSTLQNVLNVYASG